MFKIDAVSGLKIILLFPLMYISAYVLLNLSTGFSITKLFFSLLLIVSAILLIVFFYQYLKKSIDINLYFKIMIGLLIAWSIFAISRSIHTNPKDMITLLGHHQVGALTWLAPLAFVFGLNIINWLKIFNYIGKILIVGILLGIIFFPYQNEFGIQAWLHFLPILLLTSFYHTKQITMIVVLALLMFIAISISTSQRVNFLYFILLLTFFLFEFFREKDTRNYKKIFVLLALLATILLSSIYMESYFMKAMSNQELTTDTRTFLFKELFADMSDLESLIGRGALGTYYSPYFYYTMTHGLPGDAPIRSTSEVGYLFMILKGGYIMVALYILVLLPAAYLGMFKSNNVVARMSGYLILLYLILWTISYSPSFESRFIILWMAVGTCISPLARSLSNNDLTTIENGRHIFAKK